VLTAAAYVRVCQPSQVTGRLVVCGVPIGNPADAGPRLAQALRDADLVAAEDTRRTRRLAQELGIDREHLGRVVAHHEHNERESAAGLVGLMLAGAVVALVTDAGMPAVSDPGFRVVAAAVAAGIPVTVVPGPSSVTAALAVSGLPSDRWCVEGFLPRQAGARRTRCAQLGTEERTMVFLEAPHRIAATLADLALPFGAGRSAVLCRELTKTHEEIVRGSLGSLLGWAEQREVLGELTLVVAGASGSSEVLDLAGLVSARMATGESRRDAVDAVAGLTGTPRRRVYEVSLGSGP
jgi:16S rRNA (cytidine1402-2'-O)-methyltransferase